MGAGRFQTKYESISGVVVRVTTLKLQSLKTSHKLIQSSICFLFKSTNITTRVKFVLQVHVFGCIDLDGRVGVNVISYLGMVVRRCTSDYFSIFRVENYCWRLENRGIFLLGSPLFRGVSWNGVGTKPFFPQVTTQCCYLSNKWPWRGIEWRRSQIKAGRLIA